MHRALAAATLVLGVGLASAAAAQSLTPMTTAVGSVSDRFLVKLDVGNPYGAAMEFRVLAYDLDNRPIPDLWVNPPTFTLQPGGLRRILASAPFDGADSRQVLICAETFHPQASGANIRGQVCSRVLARRWASPGSSKPSS